jgi:hypothetical protein
MHICICIIPQSISKFSLNQSRVPTGSGSTRNGRTSERLNPQNWGNVVQYTSFETLHYCAPLLLLQPLPLTLLIKIKAFWRLFILKIHTGYYQKSSYHILRIIIGSVLLRNFPRTFRAPQLSRPSFLKGGASHAKETRGLTFRDLSPRANYTCHASAASRRS